AAARSNVAAGDPGKWLRRSDFSHCTSCENCAGGYGGGPETRLSADTLIATTHWLDGHGDHAALGAFVGERAALADGGRTVAFAVIHANSAGGHAYADCWYPEPAAIDCPCFLPPAREGILDCSAYLRSFGRRTEVFVVKRKHEQ
ncbi:MAG: hypothetical protein P8X98_09425, partial [Woeseiaceae bacterium]